MSRQGGPAYDGEADLVVAHPELGILVLEVKAGEPTKDAAGRWWIGGHELTRSPFLQAEDSKHALLGKLTDLPDWPANRPPYAGHSVALPGADLASLPRGHVLEWAALHRPELSVAWDMAHAGEPPGKIAPLP